jgi:hypothetical protein
MEVADCAVGPRGDWRGRGGTQVGKSVLTVRRCRRRYAAKGVDGLLKDATRPGASR